MNLTCPSFVHTNSSMVLNATKLGHPNVGMHNEFVQFLSVVWCQWIISEGTTNSEFEQMLPWSVHILHHFLSVKKNNKYADFFTTDVMKIRI